ncbi:MAG: thioredoxin family protein [Planctomycetota bacterium]|nr:thioredoxin family protein [Planctomycetota bacterium]
MNNGFSYCHLMPALRDRCWLILLAFFGIFLASTGVSSSLVFQSAARADDGADVDGLILKKKGTGGFGGFGSGSFGGFDSKSKDSYRFSGTFKLDETRTKGEIAIICNLDSGYYIYSVTQPSGGPMRTTIAVKTPSITLSEPFRSDTAPKVSEGERGFENVKVEKHFQQAVWRARFESTQMIDPTRDEIKLSLNGQVCRDGACIPLQNQSIIAVSANLEQAADYIESGTSIDAPPSGTPPPSQDVILETQLSAPPGSGVSPAASMPFQFADDLAIPGFESALPGTFKSPRSRVSWQIALSPNSAAPGTMAELVLTAVTDPPFHLYEVRPTDTNTESSTTIAITEKSGLRMGTPIPSEPPTRIDLIPGELSISYHGQSVSWRIPIEIPSGTPDGDYPIAGKVGYQACTDKSCEDPLGLQFSGSLAVRKGLIEGQSAGKFSESASSFRIESIPHREASTAPTRLTWIDASLQGQSRVNASSLNGADLESGKPISLGALFGYFALAMAGGLVLNLMPCVLPVIGLKVMSFVQESKQSSSSVSILNLWYVAGILSVFMLLATITVVAREAFGTTFGWGSQFGYFGFRAATTILMFAMALSFLGVWEIPIPGFATSHQSSQLMRREGAIGAYFKGLLTTVLATPCSGPGLGAVFSLSIDQAPWVILLMYFAIGIGMSLPYILIAMNPSLLAWMPKPGPWMQTLKEVLAFPLLLSVVWMLTTFSDDYRIAMLTCLIFVWLACWWIGKIPPWSEWNRKFIHWTAALSVAIAGCAFAIQYLGPYKNLIDWQPYEESTLVSYRTQGKAVMIDFTAQWCANCKVNLATAIETEKVAKVIRQNGIVPMIADHTELPDHITRKLEELKSTAIPVLAIYPGGLSSPPIIMRDLLTEQQVITALEKAILERESPDTSPNTSRLSRPVSTQSTSGGHSQ